MSANSSTLTGNLVKQIPRDKLFLYRWYLGRGRCSNVGFWDGQFFNTFSVSTSQFGGVRHKQEGYYTEQDGCFQPFKLVEEGKVAESVDPIAEAGWDKHYARTMRFTKES
jgi:hypothetical protein